MPIISTHVQPGFCGLVADFMAGGSDQLLDDIWTAIQDDLPAWFRDAWIDPDDAESLAHETMLRLRKRLTKYRSSGSAVRNPVGLTCSIAHGCLVDYCRKQDSDFASLDRGRLREIKANQEAVYDYYAQTGEGETTVAAAFNASLNAILPAKRRRTKSPFEGGEPGDGTKILDCDRGHKRHRRTAKELSELESLVKQLPPDLQETFNLELAGVKQTEIAAQLGLTVWAIEKRLQQAKALLRQLRDDAKLAKRLKHRKPISSQRKPLPDGWIRQTILIVVERMEECAGRVVFPLLPEPRGFTSGAKSYADWLCRLREIRPAGEIVLPSLDQLPSSPGNRELRIRPSDGPTRRCQCCKNIIGPNRYHEQGGKCLQCLALTAAPTVKAPRPIRQRKKIERELVAVMEVLESAAQRLALRDLLGPFRATVPTQNYDGIDYYPGLYAGCKPGGDYKSASRVSTAVPSVAPFILWIEDGEWIGWKACGWRSEAGYKPLGSVLDDPDGAKALVAWEQWRIGETAAGNVPSQLISSDSPVLAIDAAPHPMLAGPHAASVAPLRIYRPSS